MALNLRKIIILTLFIAFGISNGNSVPVEPGTWHTLTLTDGTTVRAELYGDEWFTFYLDKDKNAYIQAGHGTFQRITAKQLDDYLSEARTEASKHRRRRLSPLRRVGLVSDTNLFRGEKKGLVILVEFNDIKFSNTIYGTYSKTSVNELYQSVINQKNFDGKGFHGSVKDYFYEQSRGVFTLDFDVVGPFTLSHERAFYGGNLYKKVEDNYNFYSRDARRGTLAYDAILAAEADGVDFSQYDWDDDGNIEQVFVLYAGQGQADGGSDECVWPHMSDNLYGMLVSEDNLAANGSYYYYDGSEYKPFAAVDHSQCTSSGILLDGKNVNIYACSNELSTIFKNGEATGTQICGIGTFCHEFSHCLGFPDTYDTSSSDNISMGHWDLMCSGSYNGSYNGVRGGYCPAGYTAFERWCAGWQTPIELNSPQQIVNMKPLGGTPGDVNNHGEAYIIYARGNDITGEYYLLENRQRTNWDRYVPWHGLLIYHIDYDETAWTNNRINNVTGHERMRVFQAGGNDPGYLEMDTYPYNPEKLVGWVREEFGTTAEGIITNLNSQFGSKGLALKNCYNDALTTSSDPKAVYFNGGSEAKDFEGNEITDVKAYSDADRTISFTFRKPAATTANHTLALDETVTAAQSYGKETDTNLYTSVTLDRTSKTDTWSTMWLPFSLSYDELKSAFGDNVEIAFFDGVEIDENSHHIVNFSSRTNGTQAFVPFLIKISSEDVDKDSKYAGPYTFNYVTVGSSDNTPQSVKTGGTFVGTTTQVGIPEGAWFISNNTFYKSVGKSTSKAYRAYFTFDTPVDQSLEVSPAKAVNYDDEYKWESTRMVEMIKENERMSTRIDGVEVSLDDQIVPANATIYNLSGQRIASGANALNSLPRGIYIVNGHKYIKK